MSLDSLAEALDERAEGEVRTRVPLAPLTTYRLGGPAEVYLEPATPGDLTVLAELLDAQGNDAPVLVLGRGSNVLVSDRGWPGVVVRFPPKRWAWTRPVEEDAGAGLLDAGPATSLPVVANWAARRGLAGAEFMIAIPGSIGGAVRMNAGAHGGEVADVLVEAEVVSLLSGEISSRTAADLGLEYRRSNLADTDVVLGATLRLSADDPAVVKERMEGYRRHRAETQPPAVQNAGSTFKNPPGDHAGRLVEAAGLKGFRVGGAAVSELHANFFVSDDTATAQDVYDLVHEVRSRVADATGIELEPEVAFAGDFGRGLERR